MGRLSVLIRTLLLTPMVLAACASQSAATAPRSLSSGIAGRVLIGPTCPVERAGHPCVRGYRAKIAVFAAAGHRFVRSFKSTRSGYFRVALRPGSYQLRSAGSRYPQMRPESVTVRPHRFTRIRIMFDTGIR